MTEKIQKMLISWQEKADELQKILNYKTVNCPEETINQFKREIELIREHIKEVKEALQD